MDEYRFTAPEIFVNHEAQKRSGHMGHALARLKDGAIIDFYSNVDYDRVHGHSGYGWMEYTFSRDGGKSWDKARVLEYSKKVFDEGVHTALCEKAVCAENGELCLLFQITDASLPIACEPWSEPTYITSKDGGKSWSEARICCDRKGRIYDALSHGDKVQFLLNRNEHFIGSLPEHDIALYESTDLSKGFTLKSVLPVEGIGKGYCCMEYDFDGRLLAYVYDCRDETKMPYFISHDCGKTWTETGFGEFRQLIRNPQLRRTRAGWFLHGRNGDKGDGLVIYHSDDGIHWDEGTVVIRRPGPGVAYYSNNLYLEDERRLLIQFSHVYDLNRVNIMHMFVENC